MNRLLGLVAFTIIVLAYANSSQAAECGISTTGLNFGAVDTLDSGATAPAVLTVTCTDVVGESIAMCIAIGDGSGPSDGSHHLMSNGTSSMKFGLFASPGQSQPWGSNAAPSTGQPREFTFPASAGTVSGSATVHGIVPGSQPGASKGGYGASLPVLAYYLEGDSLSCSNPTGATPASTSLSVSATVEANCFITAQDIDFGSVGLIDAPITAPGALSVTCTPGAAFTITMDEGDHYDGSSRRMQSNTGNNYISYGLFRDPSGSISWDVPFSDEATGSDDQPVHGRVLPQSAVPGSYSDTVIVTIEYN